MTGEEQLRQRTAWLDCAAEMAAAGKRAALPLYGTQSSRMRLGRGAGGDETLEIDLVCEQAMLEVLTARAPGPFVLVSEEAGMVAPLGITLDKCPWRVVVDPLDGSLNAKRGLETFAASIAIADSGDKMGDVTVAYIEDYTRPRAFAAIRGKGLLHAVSGEDESGGAAAWTASNGAAWSSAGGLGATAGDGAPAEPGAARRWERAELDVGRFENDLVEMVLLETGRPDRHHFHYQDLSVMGAIGKSKDLRVRQIGSLALALCYVAVGVADILVAAVRSRSVDIAAGLLILKEAGGGATALADDDLFDQDLDLAKRCGFVAWRAGLDGSEIVARAHELGQAVMARPEE